MEATAAWFPVARSSTSYQLADLPCMYVASNARLMPACRIGFLFAMKLEEDVQGVAE